MKRIPQECPDCKPEVKIPAIFSDVEHDQKPIFPMAIVKIEPKLEDSVDEQFQHISSILPNIKFEYKPDIKYIEVKASLPKSLPPFPVFEADDKVGALEMKSFWNEFETSIRNWNTIYMSGIVKRALWEHSMMSQAMNPYSKIPRGIVKKIQLKMENRMRERIIAYQNPSSSEETKIFHSHRLVYQIQRLVTHDKPILFDLSGAYGMIDIYNCLRVSGNSSRKAIDDPRQRLVFLPSIPCFRFPRSGVVIRIFVFSWRCMSTRHFLKHGQLIIGHRIRFSAVFIESFHVNWKPLQNDNTTHFVITVTIGTKHGTETIVFLTPNLGWKDNANIKKYFKASLETDDHHGYQVIDVLPKNPFRPKTILRPNIPELQNSLKFRKA